MNTQTLEHMKQLRLYGMHRAFEGSLSPRNTNLYTNDELICFYQVQRRIYDGT